MLTLLAAVAVMSIRQESQTADEAVHLAAGYSYIRHGDYRMNPEHPPLAKILCALPLLLFKPKLATETVEWSTADEWDFGKTFLYRNTVPAETMLFAARCSTIALTLALALAAAWWTRRRFGASAALIALGFIAFDPNLIAHGRYVTTDLVVTLFFFLSVIEWCDYLESGTNRHLMLAAVATALALASKYSALVLIPILALMYVMYAIRERRVNWSRMARATVVMAGVTVLLLGLAYLRETTRILQGQRMLPSYAKGLEALIQHERDGHPSYLLGKFSGGGWWYYFPIAFAVKTPTGVLFLIAALLVLAVMRWRRGWQYFSEIPFAVYAVGLPIVAYFGWTLTIRVDIGIRHLLPIFPLLYVMLGALASRSRFTARIALMAVLMVAAESLAAYPNYLSFFNVVSGGPAHGSDYLLDSNIDWGQDLRKLETFSAEHKDPLCVSYFGTIDASYYGFKAKDLPQTPPEPPKSLHCFAAISINNLKGLIVGPEAYAWLREQKPFAKVGGSIYVYDLR
jgi:hypothetical protein